MSLLDKYLQWTLGGKTGLTGDPVYRPSTGQIDYGLTEKIGDMFGVQRQPLTGGSVLGATVFPQTFLDPGGQRLPNTPDNTIDTSIKSGVDNGGGGGGTTEPVRDNVGSSIYNSALDIIGKRLNEAKGLARSMIERATGLRDSALGDIRDTTSIIKGRARQTSQDMETKNRMAARALNRQGSSAYDQSLVGNNNALSRTMGAANLDESAGRRSVFDQFGSAIDKANQIESAGVADWGQDVNSAFGAMSSRLDAIDQANRMIAAIRGDFTGSGADAKSTNLLASLNNLPSFSFKQSGDTSMGGNLATPVDYLSLLEEQRKRALT